MADGIDHLIINSAYEEPKYHWLHDDNGANCQAKCNTFEK